MTDGEIDEIPLTRLVKDVTESGNDDEGGKYAFLIGAGCSRPKPAEIPTGGELIDQWQKECYEWDNPDEDLDDSDEVPDDWVKTQEEEMDEDQSKYGFWFERLYTNPGRRREFIADLVEDATPTLGHIILAQIMSEGYVTNVLTPNFDDLLFDAFYLYLEDKPLLVDHRAVASEFKLTRDRPAIVKLHGDYLYDNLKNTDLETESLNSPMNEALKRTVEEYGLIVVGYSGYDKSIMGTLLNADISEYGLYWCERGSDDDEETVEGKLSEQAKELLERDRTHLVVIEGFIPMMTQFHRRIDGFELPDQEELVGRAKERADQIQEALSKYKETAEDEEEVEFAKKLEKLQTIREAYSEGNYQRVIEFWNEVIDLDPDYARAYHGRGYAKAEIGEWEAAIKDYDRALDIDPEYAEAYNNRGSAKRNLGEYEAAIEDYDRALDIDPGSIVPYLNRLAARVEIGDYQQAHEDGRQAKLLSSTPEESAVSLLFLLLLTLQFGEDTDELEQEYRSVCEQDFDTTWIFDQLDSWLEDADLDPDEREQIEEWIDMLREHKPD